MRPWRKVGCPEVAMGEAVAAMQHGLLMNFGGCWMTHEPLSEWKLNVDDGLRWRLLLYPPRLDGAAGTPVARREVPKTPPRTGATLPHLSLQPHSILLLHSAGVGDAGAGARAEIPKVLWTKKSSND